jgi:glutathione S-transferase
MTALTLVSHHLCPYVQRAAIALIEKDAEFSHSYVDLAAKPDWFRELSPLGKVPLLRVADEDGYEAVLFESAVICEYLDETIAPRLHPADPVARAKHRGWIEFASAVLSDIAGLYNASKGVFDTKTQALRTHFERLEGIVSTQGPYFAGSRFSLVDGAFGPVFRYFDAFEQYAGLPLLSALPRVDVWRAALADRPSVKAAVGADYAERLREFLRSRDSHLATLMAVANAA